MAQTLVTAQRALDFSGDLQSLLSFTCEELGIEYTREIGVYSSRILAANDKIQLNEDNTITFTIDDDDLLEAVQEAVAKSGKTIPDPGIVEVLQERLSAVEETSTDQWAIVEAMDKWSEEPDPTVSFLQTFQAVVLDRDPEEVLEYVEPTGYQNAYLKDVLVTKDGKKYRSTRNGANGIPGDSPDWILEPDGDEVLEWEQRQAGSEYPVGSIVSLEGRLYRNDHNKPNGWKPGTTGSQWTDIGPA